jgi:hypothetical protein
MENVIKNSWKNAIEKNKSYFFVLMLDMSNILNRGLKKKKQ